MNARTLSLAASERVLNSPRLATPARRSHFASTVLHDEVDIRALAEYLGHSDPGFTLRVYTHLMPGAPDRMRQAIDRALSDPPNCPGIARGSAVDS